MEDERTARERASAQSGPELTERQRIVLRAVVEDYVLNGDPGGLEGARRALRTRRLAGDRAQRHGRARGARPADAPAHQRGPGPVRPRLPPVRRVAHARCGARPGRPADDPPPVQPGAADQQRVAAACRLDPGRQHPLGRGRDAGAISTRPVRARPAGGARRPDAPRSCWCSRDGNVVSAASTERRSSASCPRRPSTRPSSTRRPPR